jgi:hypothetical protein
MSRSTSPREAAAADLDRCLRSAGGRPGRGKGLRWSEVIAARYAHTRVRAEPVVSGERRSPFPSLRQNAAGSPKTRLP